MLAIAVSLTFALSAMLALGVIALTLRQQASSVRDVIAQARALRGPRELALSPRQQTEALVFGFEPVARSRHVAQGIAGPSSTPRRSLGIMQVASARPLCAAA